VHAHDTRLPRVN